MRLYQMGFWSIQYLNGWSYFLNLICMKRPKKMLKINIEKSVVKWIAVTNL